MYVCTYFKKPYYLTHRVYRKSTHLDHDYVVAEKEEETLPNSSISCKISSFAYNPGMAQLGCGTDLSPCAAPSKVPKSEPLATFSPPNSGR